jgi:hypothetical protein
MLGMHCTTVLETDLTDTRVAASISWHIVHAGMLTVTNCFMQQPAPHLLCCKLQHCCERRLLWHAEAASINKKSFSCCLRLPEVPARAYAAYTLNGSLGSEVRVILNVTFDLQHTRDHKLNN